ncbi:MAG: FIST N-terminal domain-containing protein [bacterium]|nr:FIST N-terminal domain-containing protein [bacterium]
MSTKAGTGFSQNPDAGQAGAEACKKAMAKVVQPELIIVFASVKYDQEKLLSGIRRISGATPLIGCSDAGEIVTEGSKEKGVAVMAIESDKIDFITANGGEINGQPRQAGEKLAQELKNKGKNKLSCVMMLSDVLTGNGADIVRGAQEKLGDEILLFGGAAGDDFAFKKTFSYLNDQVLTSSLVGVGLMGKFSIGIGVRHGWEPIGLPLKVTKSAGAVVQELNNKPAIRVYEDYFGKQAEEMKKEPLAKMAITYPLGMKIKASDEFLIRDPITVDSQGAITCAAEVPVGAEVNLMIGSKEEAVAAAKKAATIAKEQLKGAAPAAILMFNCIARCKLFGRYADDEIKAIKSVLGEKVPLIGFYTYGEIAPFGISGEYRKAYFHNETAVVIAIGEK